jgi:hypothetical protein
MLEDDSEETEDENESELSESESGDDDTSVRVDALSFGDSGFDLNFKGPEKLQQMAEERRPEIAEQTPAPIEDSTSSLSPSDEYVKVTIPSTPSPKLEKSDIKAETPKETTPAVSPLPTDREREQSAPAIAPLPNELPSHLKITPPRSEKAVTPPDPVIPAQTNKSFFSPQTIPQPFQAEKAPLPPDPIIPQPRSIIPQSTQQTTTPQKIPLPNESPRQTPSPSSRKVELRQFVPIAGSTRISSKLTDSSNLSDAFRLVIEQVSKELERVFPPRFIINSSYL